MKNRIILFGLSLLLLMQGCGTTKSAEDTESTVYILQDGRIESLTVEEFPEDVYDAKELSESVRTMAENYSRDHEGYVKVERCEVKDGQAYVYLSFQSAQDYAQFNRTDFFYGTVSDALQAGYARKATLKNAFGSNTVSGDAIADMGNYHMVVINEPVQIRTYESILYISANLEPVDEQTVRVSTETNGNAILIMK